MENGALWSVYNSSSLPLLAPHSLPLVQHGSFPWATDLQEIPHALVWFPPWAARRQPASLWSLPWAAGESLLWCLEHRLLLLSASGGGAFSHIFFFLTPHRHAVICPFTEALFFTYFNPSPPLSVILALSLICLIMFSQRCCHHGQGAQLCPVVGSAGAGWDQLCLARESPGLSSPRLLPCSLGTCTQYRNI